MGLMDEWMDEWGKWEKFRSGWIRDGENEGRVQTGLGLTGSTETGIVMDSRMEVRKGVAVFVLF